MMNEYLPGVLLSARVGEYLKKMTSKIKIIEIRNEKWEIWLRKKARLKMPLVTSLSSNHTTLNFWQSEFCILTSNHQIAIQYHLNTSPISATYHGCNNRFTGLASWDRTKSINARQYAFCFAISAALLVCIPSAFDKRSIIYVYF